MVLELAEGLYCIFEKKRYICALKYLLFAGGIGKPRGIQERVRQSINRQISINIHNRGVAQLASVLAWGARGRKFESSRPDK